MLELMLINVPEPAIALLWVLSKKLMPPAGSNWGAVDCAQNVTVMRSPGVTFNHCPNPPEPVPTWAERMPLWAGGLKLTLKLPALIQQVVPLSKPALVKTLGLQVAGNGVGVGVNVAVAVAVGVGVSVVPPGVRVGVGVAVAVLVAVGVAVGAAATIRKQKSSTESGCAGLATLA